MNDEEFEAKYTQLNGSEKATLYKGYIILNETPKDAQKHVLKGVGDHGALIVEEPGLYYALRLMVEKIDARYRN